MSAQNIWAKDIERWTGIATPVAAERHRVLALQGPAPYTYPLGNSGLNQKALFECVHETLQQLDADQASKTYAGLETTIAGHANHTRYYLRNFLDFLQGKGNGAFDVVESWKIGVVTKSEWSELQRELAATYSEVMRFISQRSDWHAENQLAGAIAMITHTAYHLGAIRQRKEL